MSVQGECARQVCKAGRALYGGGRLLCGSHWLLPCTNSRGGGDGWGVGLCECARRVCKVSVQGEKCFIWGWRAVLRLPLAASLHKSKGEW